MSGMPERPSSSAPAVPPIYEWRVIRLKGTPGTFVGCVHAPDQEQAIQKAAKTSASQKKTAGSWEHTRSGKSPHDLPPVSRSSYQNARKRCDVIRLVEIALVDVDL